MLLLLSLTDCPTCENFEEMQSMIDGLRSTLDTMQDAILDVKAQNTQLWERVSINQSINQSIHEGY